MLCSSGTLHGMPLDMPLDSCTEFAKQSKKSNYNGADGPSQDIIAVVDIDGKEFEFARRASLCRWRE